MAILDKKGKPIASERVSPFIPEIWAKQFKQYFCKSTIYESLMPRIILPPSQEKYRPGPKNEDTIKFRRHDG